MSTHPFCFEFERPGPTLRSLLEQHFGGLTPQDDRTIVVIPQKEFIGPLRNLQAAARDAGSTIKQDKDKFHINMDVQHFAPEEISVKTIDGFLVIKAKHDEKQDDHGYVSRSFTRRYSLPDGVEADLVISKLSSDGVLSITAPLKAPPKAANERIVPIVETGPVEKQVDGGGEETPKN